MAQMVVTDEGGEGLPNWLMVEIVRDLPRLVVKNCLLYTSDAADE